MVVYCSGVKNQNVRSGVIQYFNLSFMIFFLVYEIYEPS